MTKFVIAVMGSGFTVTQQDPVALSLRETLYKAAAQQAHVTDAAAYSAQQMAGMATRPAPTEPLAHAFSTLAEVERYIRNQLGYDEPVTNGSNEVSAGIGNAVGANSPSGDFDAQYRRRDALAQAAQTFGAGSDPTTIVQAAEVFEQYIRGDKCGADATPEMIRSDD